MTSRREFLQITFAASVLPLAAGAVEGTGPAVSARDRADAVPLYKVLYDTRFPASVAFARRVAAQGVVTQAMTGDMTQVWYDDLYHRWARGPAAIAGLTAYGALFCLERLAWDQRMRVVFRGEHKAAAPGSIAHDFTGAPEIVSAACRAAAEPAWAAAMGDVVTRCPGGRAASTTAHTFRANRGTRVPESEPLFSWVIAPAARAEL